MLFRCLLYFQLPHLVESNVDISELIRTAFTSPAARQFEVWNVKFNYYLAIL